MFDWPVEVFQPSPCSQHWHGTIGVTGEEEHLEVRLMFHDTVDPKGALVLLMPLFINVVIALNPSSVLVHEEVVRNAKLGLNSWRVQIVTHFLSSNLRLQWLLALVHDNTWMILVPSSNVIFEGKSSLVGSLFAVQDGLSIPVVFELSAPNIVVLL